ncbi:uncharacterized protein LOC129910265 [Episyrphus balteatus]|uniref:uncharacterized protein LOC129910265 n=1 Tax=Episyrphus balteatus TaxID=286459 RepID=UPI002485FE7A|nr:uncharacterized protein LOC129910265 [Episyrphus balteatus]
MQEFETKRNALFASLDIAGKDLKGTILDQTGPESHTVNLLKRCAPAEEISSDRTLTKLRGKESIFKKPELPIAKCLKPRVAPDYQVNPHKWKKYSLADVDLSSDHTNTAAALSFLKEIESIKDSDESEEASSGKISFNKSVKAKRSIRVSGEIDDEEVDRPKLKGSKLVMPEYVVGQKAEKDKRKKRSPNKVEKSSQLTLSHLQEDEDED